MCPKSFWNRHTLTTKHTYCRLHGNTQALQFSKIPSTFMSYRSHSSVKQFSRIFWSFSFNMEIHIEGIPSFHHFLTSNILFYLLRYRMMRWIAPRTFRQHNASIHQFCMRPETKLSTQLATFAVLVSSNSGETVILIERKKRQWIQTSQATHRKYGSMRTQNISPWRQWRSNCGIVEMIHSICLNPHVWHKHAYTQHQWQLKGIEKGFAKAMKCFCFYAVR